MRMHHLVKDRMTMYLLTGVAVLAAAGLVIASLVFAMRVISGAGATRPGAPAPSPSVIELGPSFPGMSSPALSPAPSATTSRAPSRTYSPDPVETKAGAATCAIAAEKFADAVSSQGTDAQWQARMRPLVTGSIEDVLPSIDRSSIPAGVPQVGQIYAQEGACDVALVWPEVVWSVAFINQGSGWLAGEWRIG